ncbi:T9SS type A sorting domain-containing protein [Candidatus Latescibacterota bacterium]
MLYFLVLLVYTFSFYFQNAPYAFENGRWVHHQRQAPQNDIMSIHALPDGKIWVDTYQQPYHVFHIFDGQKWQKISCHSDTVGTNPPFFSDRNGRFYFFNNNSNKLVVWEYGSSNESINEYYSGELAFPLTGAVSNNDTLYIGSYNTEKGGIYKFDGEEIIKIKNGPTRSLTFDPSGRLWAAHKAHKDSVMRLIVLENDILTDDHTVEIDSVKVLSKLDNLTVQTSPDGTIWINNRGKYGIYNGGKWYFYDSSSTASPLYMSFDNSGGVWGYGNNYIYRLGENNTWYLSREMGTIINNQYFIAAASDSTLWTCDSENIYRYSEDQVEPSWVLVTSNLDLASDTVTCIAYTDEGKLVCGHGVRGVDYVDYPGSEKAGISILTDSTWYNYRGYDNISLRNVYDLLELDTGNILVYADFAYSIFYGYTWEVVDSLYIEDKDLGHENDMIKDGETVWIATDNGLLEHDFIDFPNVLYSPVSYYQDFYNLFMDSFGIFYMQNRDGKIISYNRYAEDQWWEELFGYDLSLRDFVVDYEDEVRIFWAIRQNNLSMSYGLDYLWENVKCQETGEEIALNDASLIHIDEEGRIWASGYDNTGYLEDGIWHRIPELAGFASSAYARSEDGKIALNAIEVIEYDQYPFDKVYDDRIDYYGVFEYYPDQQSIVSEEKPNPFSVIANYPNPFNSFTTISFELSYREDVNISVYNILGQQVKTLAERIFPAGKNNVVWDSKSDSGISMSSGIYFYHIKTKNAECTGKMLLLR